MKHVFILGLAVSLFFCAIHTQAQPPFYSADEYQLGHSLFAKLIGDLNATQANAPAALLEQARSGVYTLEHNWSQGVYDSRQMDLAIAGLETLIDKSFSLRDRANLGEDLSRLLDLRQQYY
jgi:hypothetical protein